MMRKDEYESLISSPGWSAMKGFLFDYRARIAEDIADGNIKKDDRDEAIYRCQAIRDLAEMDWPTIAKFYGIPLEESKETE